MKGRDKKEREERREEEARGKEGRRVERIKGEGRRKDLPITKYK